MPDQDPPVTSDGRYIVVKGRLWRAANPNLAAVERERLVKALMKARSAVKAAGTTGSRTDMREARAAVLKAKVELGERGPVWWTDGAPDFNRHMARNTPYAEWFASL